MFGSVSEWFYRWLAGIRPDPKFPGFKEFLITPSTPEGLDFVNCTYNSPYGSIVSNWRKEPSGNYHFEMTVPDGSLAHVDLPVSANQHIEIEKAGTALPPVIPGLETGLFDLEGGQYIVTVAPLDP
jgi:alpha-L-rhamnosidase